MARPAEFDRKLVLEQAEELFWRQGYRATTINDLVQVTGMQPGSLYAAFKSKENLFMLVINQYADELLNSIRVIFSECKCAYTAIKRFTEMLLEQASDGVEWKGCLLVNSMIEFGYFGSSEIQTRLRSIHSELEQIFAHKISEAKSKGELSDDADPDSLAFYLVTCFWGFNAIRGTQPGSKKLADIMNNILIPLT